MCVNALCSHSRTTYTSSTQLLQTFSGVGWGGWINWGSFIFPNSLCNASLLIMPKECEINVLNNKLENETVLPRPLGTVKRKFQLQSTRKVKCAVGHTRPSKTMTIISIPTLFLAAGRHQAARAKKSKMPRMPMMDSKTVILWACNMVEFLQPLLIESHHFVFKTWCFKMCLIVKARNKG